MVGQAEKISFLKNDFISLLKQTSTDTLPAWGKMGLQQMIEHFSDAVRAASGKLAITQIFTPEENLPKMRAFLMSDKPFRENTPNPKAFCPVFPDVINFLWINEPIRIYLQSYLTAYLFHCPEGQRE